MQAIPFKPDSDTRLQKLPAPVPGVVINIPIDLYPAYMRLHGYEPVEYQNGITIIRKGDFNGTVQGN
jgi:hypothetical protein